MKEKNAYINGEYIGFIADGKMFLQRCPMCHSENYDPAVATGQCAFCGHKQDPNDKNIGGK